MQSSKLKSSRLAWSAIAVIALLTLGAWWFGGRVEGPSVVLEAESPGEQVVSDARGWPDEAAVTAADSLASEEPASDPEPEEEGDSSALSPEVERFLALNRHPPSSRPLTTDSFDLLNPDARYEQRLPIEGEPGSGAWEVLFSADRYAVRGDEAANLHLEVWRDGAAVALEGVRFTAEVPGREGGRHVDGLSSATEGSEYRTSFRPGALWPDHVGPVRVRVTFEAEGLGAKEGILAFYSTPEAHIPARFTGELGDRIESGDLVVDIELEVDVGGRYRVEGNLYDRYGNPIAWSRFQQDLEPGKQTASLRYHGLIFHDAGVGPPFRFKTLRGYRMQPESQAHRVDILPLEGDWEVGSRYILEDFHAREYQSAHKEKMIDMYQDARSRGVRFSGE